MQQALQDVRVRPDGGELIQSRPQTQDNRYLQSQWPVCLGHGLLFSTIRLSRIITNIMSRSTFALYDALASLGAWDNDIGNS